MFDYEQELNVEMQTYTYIGSTIVQIYYTILADIARHTELEKRNVSNASGSKDVLRELFKQRTKPVHSDTFKTLRWSTWSLVNKMYEACTEFEPCQQLSELRRTMNCYSSPNFNYLLTSSSGHPPFWQNSLICECMVKSVDITFLSADHI